MELYVWQKINKPVRPFYRGSVTILFFHRFFIRIGRENNRPFGNLGIGIGVGVISIKFATRRLETCDLVRKCFAKISRRKFSDNLKRVTVKNPYGKASALESLLNEIAGINSRLASLVKKSPHLVEIQSPFCLYLQNGLKCFDLILQL